MARVDKIAKKGIREIDTIINSAWVRWKYFLVVVFFGFVWLTFFHLKV